MRDHALPDGGRRSHREMTPACVFQPSLGQTAHQYNQPPFMMLRGCSVLFFCFVFLVIRGYNSIVFCTLLSTLDASEAADRIIEGVCATVSRDPAQQDHTGRCEGVKRVARSGTHLCFYQHVALERHRRQLDGLTR